MLVGIDPSYRCTGISYLFNRSCGSVIVSTKLGVGNSGVGKSFSKAYLQAERIADEVVDLISSVLSSTEDNELMVIMETPPPTGEWSPGLFGLDMVLSDNLNRRVAPLVSSYSFKGVSSRFLSHLHGSLHYKKSESVRLAQDLIRVLVSENPYVYSQLNSKRMNSDMAESLLFLCYGIVLTDRVGVDDILAICEPYSSASCFDLTRGDGG